MELHLIIQQAIATVLAEINVSQQQILQIQAVFQKSHYKQFQIIQINYALFLHYQFTIIEKEFTNELTCMTTNQYRLFVGDNIGTIFVFSFENGPLHAIHQIKQDVIMHLSSIQYCPIKNYLICGSKEGYLSVFEIGTQGKEKNSNQITLLKTLPNKIVQFSISTKEIYVNYGNFVVILESTNMKYLYSLDAHDKELTKIQLFDSIGLLVTSSKDNSLKFWYSFSIQVITTDWIDQIKIFITYISQLQFFKQP